MAYNKNIDIHQEWIGYLNPTGLVFSPQALEDAQVVINAAVVKEQKDFSRFICNENQDGSLSFKGVGNCKQIFTEILGWRESDLDNSHATISKYTFNHPQFGEVISPDFISKLSEEQVLLIKAIEELDVDLNKNIDSDELWNSSYHFKFERLLRETQASVGIIVTRDQLRLIYAPRGETSGFINFPFHIMYQPSGRLVFSAFVELFSETQVFNSPKGQSLLEILESSRKYQAKVSVALSGQVLAALYELLRGFQAANDEDNGELLKEPLSKNPQEIYEGLLTVLLRMVFIMYAEDRDLLASDEVYEQGYSLAGLYDRLRQDEAQNPDTMDSRYGAWAHLLSLFRLIYDGATYESSKGIVNLPARHGHLFDPDKYLYLEGRTSSAAQYSRAPKISDGIIYKVLSNLLVLNGERISYRTLDVEQIGSVYETMMGFELDVVQGETVALRPSKSHGAPIPINLEDVLTSKDRGKNIAEMSGISLTEKIKKELGSAKSVDELENILEKRIDRRATPNRLSKGAMVLSPSEERRKSGSHYTPRELTEPIVRMGLRPIFESFGRIPEPEQILALRICDPAMGSGAFLVETCRQLAEKLIESWGAYKTKINLPPDEDELLYAKRLVAQRCLYGVDKNHMAVNLAKLSLWLTTLSRNHAFSFLDHNLKHGDSLVGLTNKQIMTFDYKDQSEPPLFAYMKEKIVTAQEARFEIQNATEEHNYDALTMVADSYTEEINPLRLVGNLAVKCFFDGKNKKGREENIQKYQVIISNFFAANDDEGLMKFCCKNLESLERQIMPFHWELEFPEIFSGESQGFDCIIGNPPFQGKNTIVKSNVNFYLDWLKELNCNSHGNSDLVAHFFRKCFDLLKLNGTLGFISTNTVSQGDTRESGLQQILKNGGEIYNVKKRVEWPGVAAVVVSIVHLVKGKYQGIKKIDDRKVELVTSYFFHQGSDEKPKQLKSNINKSFKGVCVLGLGFTFNDIDKKENVNPTSLMYEILKADPSCKKHIKPYLGGEEVSQKPDQSYHKYIIDFGQESESYAKKYEKLYKLIEKKVKPSRMKQNDVWAKEKWWQLFRPRPELNFAKNGLDRVLVACQTSKYFSFAFTESEVVFDQKLVIITLSDYEYFGIVQSTVHQVWALFFGSTMKDDPVYTSSDCFETFPFPDNDLSELRKMSLDFYTKRQNYLLEKNIGLTKFYNLFHDPDCTSLEVISFREEQIKIDTQILELYGWEDLKLIYDFQLDYIVDEDSKRKKPWRYKFTPEVHDEILARLLELNQERYEEEVRLGLHKK